MRREIYEKLKETKSIIRVYEGEYINVLVNAGGRKTPRLYNFAFNNDTNEPILKEITEESVLKQIGES